MIRNLLLILSFALTVAEGGTLQIARGNYAGGSSPAITAPISYWSFDNSEANGAVAIDSETTGTAQDLTDSGGCLRETGKLGNAIRTGGNDFAFRLDSADLSVPNDTSFSVSVWVKAATLTNYGGIFAKGVDASIGYRLGYHFGDNRFFFQVGTSAVLEATTLGAPSTGVWYHIVAIHDKDANTISIQVNNGTVNSISYSAGSLDDTDAARLGQFNTGSITYYWDGWIDELYFGKNVLTAQEITDLYNSGNGYRPPGL